jgi:hypothetical protein
LGAAACCDVMKSSTSKQRSGVRERQCTRVMVRSEFDEMGDRQWRDCN